MAARMVEAPLPQGGASHFDAGSRAFAVLDCVWLGMPRAAVEFERPVVRTAAPPDTVFQAGLSDHAPVGVVFGGAGAPAPRWAAPLPRWVLRAPRFQEKLGAVLDAAGLDKVEQAAGPVARWRAHKDCIQEAARLTIEAGELDEGLGGAVAEDRSLARLRALARSVWLGDGGLARKLMEIDPALKQHIAWEGARPKLVAPTVFEDLLADRHRVVLERRAGEHEKDKKAAKTRRAAKSAARAAASARRVALLWRRSAPRLALRGVRAEGREISIEEEPEAAAEAVGEHWLLGFQRPDPAQQDIEDFIRRRGPFSKLA